MKNLTEFLKEFGISESEFKLTGLVWKELLKIQTDYEKYIPELSLPANYLVEAFHTVKSVHSVRFRLKNPVHLIAKIVRKKLEESDRVIDLKNYREEITDLIGLRALHLFKEDWLLVHYFIMSNWNLKEAPIAYYRNGDSPEYIDVFKKNGCIVKEHPFGYRSVHYLVITSPSKSTYVAEVQVRTIFEEGWSEIDHRIRYPYDTKNNLLNQFLVIFNRLSGSADEMGSYVQNLKYELAKREKEFAEDLNKKVQIIEDLKGKIRELELKPKVAKEWVNNLDEILKLSKSSANQYEFKLPDFSQMEFPDYSSIKLFDTSKMKLHDYTEVKLPDYTKMKLPDYTEVRLPDYTKMKLPDYTEVRLPDYTKMKLPDYTEVKLPEYTKMKLPDYTEVKLPDNSGLQKSDNKEAQHSENNLEEKSTTAKRKSTPSKKKPKTNIKKPNQKKIR